ncbi:hypothetical protein THAOC_11414, partial [Thalassiosira oceanica]
TNGHATYGHATYGHATDGHATYGRTRNGWTGHATDGHTATVQTQTVHAVLARAAASLNDATTGHKLQNWIHVELSRVCTLKGLYLLDTLDEDDDILGKSTWRAFELLRSTIISKWRHDGREGGRYVSLGRARGGTCQCSYPLKDDVYEEVGLFPIHHYIEVRRQTIAAYNVNRPILMGCHASPRAYRRNSPTPSKYDIVVSKSAR